MKKLVIILIAICILFAGALGYLSWKNSVGDAAVQTPAAEETAAATATATETPAVTVQTIDYEKLYAAHEPDEVVFTVDGRETTWEDLFYWIHYYGSQVENYFTQMSSYSGTAFNWSDEIEAGTSYAGFVTVGAEEAIRQIAAIEGFAKENDVTLTEENEKAIAERLASDISSTCGEGATEEEFYAKMAETYLPRALYERMNRANYYYKNGFIKLYGENGELVDDAAALTYLEDNGYLSAGHILLMIVDPETGEALDEETIAEKKVTAETLAAELGAIEDKDALIARFAELKTQYCEDPGKTLYPDGYTFLSGKMVAEFENACNALAEYEVSDVVETSYGYHVIIRLPLDPDRIVEYSSEQTPMTARSLMANEEYNERVQAYLEAITVDYSDGFEVPDITKYLK